MYIRDHYSYRIFNVYKVGITTNLYLRNETYKTGEYYNGNYIKVIQLFDIDNKLFNFIDRNIKLYFKKLHTYYKGGNEFYDVSIYNKIDKYFKKTNLNYKIFINDEIKKIIFNESIECIIKDLKSKKLDVLFKQLKYNTNINTIKPHDIQKEIIKNCIDYFKINNKGIIILPCGFGKTLISLWIIKKLKLNKVIIGVPNIILLEQWKKFIKLIKYFDNFKIYLNFEEHNIKINNNFNFIILTTYTSSYKLKNIKTDIIIFDEVHHLTTYNKNNIQGKEYCNILNINAKYTLSLTATIKEFLIENKNDDVIDNLNINFFGNIIVKHSLKFGIINNLICDFRILTNVYETNYKEKFLNIYDDKLIIEQDELAISIYSAIESIKKYNCYKIIIFCNNVENCKLINNNIDICVYNKFTEFTNKIYHHYYTSDICNNMRNKIIDIFQKSKYGILTCCYLLGEGIDIPCIDTCIFAENMDSNIRIIQSSLRCCRKDKYNINKIGTIIIPCIKNNDFNIKNNKITNIIYKLCSENDSIINKITINKINIDKENDNEHNENNNEHNNTLIYENIKLKFLEIFREGLNITYKKAKHIVKKYNIDCIQDYMNICDIDKRLNKDPCNYFNKNFVSWIDYLNIDIKKYYNVNEIKNIINKHLIKNNILINNPINIIYYIENNFDNIFNKDNIDIKVPKKDMFNKIYNNQCLLIRKHNKDFC